MGYFILLRSTLNKVNGERGVHEDRRVDPQAYNKTGQRGEACITAKAKQTRDTSWRRTGNRVTSLRRTVGVRGDALTLTSWAGYFFGKSKPGTLVPRAHVWIYQRGVLVYTP